MQFAFGPFVLDTACRELRHEEVRRPLSPKALQLLVLIVERRPRPVSKAELMAALWPDTFVVEANVPNLVVEIRAALAEGRAGGFVRTVHGLGYAFDGEVEERGSESARPGAAPALRAMLVLTWRGGRAALGAGAHDLGRDPEAAVVLEHRSISRRHARIQVGGSGVLVEDLGSKNGTFLADRRVGLPVPLEDGDELRLGAVRLRVHAVGGEATETFKSN